MALGYFLSCLAVIQLRRAEPGTPRAYRVPGGVLTAGLGAGASFFMLASSIYRPYAATRGLPLEWWVMAIWALLGWGLWVHARKARASLSEAERRPLIVGQATRRVAASQDPLNIERV